MRKKQTKNSVLGKKRFLKQPGVNFIRCIYKALENSQKSQKINLSMLSPA